jgi:hypothetical protein
MGSPLYTLQLMSYQGLEPGDSAICQVKVGNPAATIVIKDVSYYFGSPSAVVSNSVVLLDLIAAVGIPTVDAFDSGESGSTNPIWIQHPRNYAFANIVYSGEFVSIFKVTNTSESEAAVDVTVSGWALGGTCPTLANG